MKRLTACLLGLLGSVAMGVERPNFVFILVDDLGYKDLGCYGSEFYETPNLDRLAKSGVQFLDGYAAHPVCSPTRASLMTGQNPARIGITDWIRGSSKTGPGIPKVRDLHHLPLEHVTIAEAMKEAGYRTFFAGKWHLNDAGEEGFYPENQGFDVNKGGHHKGSPPGGYYAPYKNPKLEDGPEGEYLPDRLTNETIRFIEANKERPFFAYLSFYTVHVPIQACRRHIVKFEKKAKELGEGGGVEAEHDGFTRLRQDNAAYASMVHAMDENVGRLLAKLDELKLSEKTVVVFTSDNGGLTTLGRNKGGPTSVRPLRAGKGWCYEGGIRVPWIIRAPGVSREGAKSEVPIYSADAYPTILELAGLAPKPEQHKDGKSLVPLLRDGKAPEREFIVWFYPHYHGSKWRPGAAIRAGKWKLVEHYAWKKVELFDLEEDPGEKKDLSGENPEKMQELLAKMRGYLDEVAR